MKITDKNNKQVIKQKTKDLVIAETLRSEFHFLKFPFFDISPRRPEKRDRIEIKEIEKTEEGEIEVWWKVIRGLDNSFPSSFARRVHKEIVEKTINNIKKPIPRLIQLGSLRQMCRELNIVDSGNNKKNIKKALKDIKRATIAAKGTFRLKEKNGIKKSIEADFNLYDELYFTGEILPDGTEANAVYVLLSSYYVQNFNNNFVIPLDYQYIQLIRGDIASRMYEVLSVWFYPALEHGKKYIEKEYSELCNFFPLTRQSTKKKARGQIKKAHLQHVINGFLACEPEWENIGKKDNWLIRYWIGEKAKSWYKQNKRVVYTNQETKQLEKPEKEEERRQGNKKQSDVIKQLLELGVTKRVAEGLGEKGNIDFIEDWIDAVHETKAENKAGFLVKAIQEKWEIPAPLKKKKRKLVGEKEERKEEEVKERYNQYIINELDEYIKKIDKGILEKELKEYEDIYYKKFPFYKQFKESDKMKPYIERDYKHNKAKELGLLSFEEWVEGQKLPK